MNGPQKARYDVTLTRHDGQDIAAVLPTIDEDASPLIREGVARRRIAAITGVCPCGGRLTLPNRAARRQARRDRRPIHADVAHEVDCPAIDDALVAAFRPDTTT